MCIQALVFAEISPLAAEEIRKKVAAVVLDLEEIGSSTDRSQKADCGLIRARGLFAGKTATGAQGGRRLLA